MATIKLTGFNISTARNSVAGDTDVVALDGSLTIGNADTDAVVFNAEIDSDIIPDDNNTWDLGSASKYWAKVHSNTVYAYNSIEIGSGASVYVLPTGDGSAGSVIATDGAGRLDFYLPKDLAIPSYISFGLASSNTNDTVGKQLETAGGSTNGRGYRMPIAGSVTHITGQFDCTARTATTSMIITLYKNGVATASTLNISVGATGDFSGTANLGSTVTFAAGDALTVFARHAGTGITTSNISVLLRVVT